MTTTDDDDGDTTVAEDDLEDEEVFTDYDEEVCRMTAQPKRQLNKGRGPFLEGVSSIHTELCL